MLKDLLAAIVDDNRTKANALLKAVPGLATNCIAEAKLYGTGISHWTYVGDTPLHLAAAGHRVEIVQSLLAAGADPNAFTNHRHSGPLHYAADGYVIDPEWNPERQAQTIKRLIDAGAKVNAQDKNGATPLHRAVRTRCAAAVELLLSSGADAVARNKSGSTPFHLAVQNTGRGGSGDDKAIIAQKQIIEKFLSIGLSTDLKDGKGNTVLESAKSGWVREVLLTRR